MIAASLAHARPPGRARRHDRSHDLGAILLGVVDERDGWRWLTREGCDYRVTIERAGAIAWLKMSDAVVLAALACSTR
jgi:hypothetical protein